MEISIAVSAAVAGYLLGSISFIRVFARFRHPATDIERIEVALPDGSGTFRSDSVSATAARLHMGTSYGCFTGILDMLKVAVPTLAFMLWQRDEPYHLIVAAAGLAGHDWPIYHRFKGGRGESPIYGALIVISPLGVLATNAAGAILGVVIGHILILRWAGLVLMIPWLWFTTESWPHLAYIIFANVVYWVSMRPELTQYYDLSKGGAELSQETIAGELGMGARLGRIMDRYSILALCSRSKGE
jgi:glycerol-3-phosphate acyltransferase PlsY